MSSRALKWTIAIAAALFAHAALYWCVAFARGPDQALRRSTRQITEIQYIDARVADRSEAFEQQLALFDPRPLLLPTEWNAANAQRLGDFLEEEETIFPDFDPVLKAESEAFFRAYGSQAAAAPLEETLQSFARDPLDGVGRASLGIESSPQDGVELLARDPQTGRVVARRIASFPMDGGNGASGSPAWEPAALLGTLRDGFLSTGLSVVRSSGFDEIDARLRDLVRRELSGARGLPDGAYIIEINP